MQKSDRMNLFSTRLCAFLLIAFIAVSQVQAARVQLIVVGDTNDRTVGENVQQDIWILVGQMQSMGKKSLMPPVQITGDDCRPERITQVLDDLHLHQDDAVVFYYSGHGARDQQKGYFMEIPRLGRKAVVSRDEIRDKISGWVDTKQIRLGVVITDMCNLLKVILYTPPPSAPAAAAAAPPLPQDDPLFAALFVDSRGFVDVNSAEDDEMAMAFRIKQDRRNGQKVIRGSFFTENLAELMRQNTFKRYSWKQVLEEGVKPMVAAEFQREYPEGIDIPNQPGRKQFTQTVQINKLAELFRGASARFAQAGQRLGVNLDPNPVVVQTRRGSVKGMRILTVTPGMPAEGMLDPGDIIISINGQRTRNVDEFREAVGNAGHIVRPFGRNIRNGQVHEFLPIHMGGGQAQLEQPEEVEQPRQLKLGTFLDTQIYNVTTENGIQNGVRIINIQAGTPADGMLDPGDIILSINGFPTPTIAAYQQQVEAAIGQIEIIGWNSRTQQVESFPVINLK